VVNPDLPEAERYVLLGAALRELRKRAGFKKQQDAAEAIGIRNVFLSQIENGRRGMRWHTLLKILEAYGSSVRELGELLD
jgi:transcriptional regulator with XRE-family HTH domain